MRSPQIGFPIRRKWMIEQQLARRLPLLLREAAAATFGRMLFEAVSD